MILEIRGKSYKIKLNSNIEGIIPKKIDNNTVELEVSPILSEKELIAYIKHSDLKISKANSNKHDSISINIFDQEYNVQHTDKINSYIQGQTIFTNKNIRLKSGLKELQELLFNNLLNKELSDWEERLNIFIPEVKIKMLKSNYFKIASDNQCIIFSKKLMFFSIPVIQYIVLLMIKELIQLEEIMFEKFLHKHVNNWKHSQRILAYERDKNY